LAFFSSKLIVKQKSSFYTTYRQGEQQNPYLLRIRTWHRCLARRQEARTRAKKSISCPSYKNTPM